MLGVVDFHALGNVIWASFVAGVGVTVLFSIAIYGFGRADEQRRSGHAATAYVALAVVAMVVFAAAVVYGVAVMLNK
jgi:hypothetical protein